MSSEPFELTQSSPGGRHDGLAPPRHARIAYALV
jgi:hypothetical protein